MIEDKVFYLSDFEMYTPEYERRALFLRDDSSGMYFYDPVSLEIHTLYDYTLQPGDSYVIYPLLDEITDSLVVTLDSVRTEMMGGEMLRVQYVSTQSISHQERQNHWVLGESFTDNKAVIVEHIGSLGFLLPQEIGWNDDFSTGICSFNSDDFFYYINDTVDCNSPIILSVQESVEQEVEIHPNPAHNTLTVESASAIREIIVYDMAGHAVMVETMCTSSLQQTINITSLHAGIYLVKVVTANGTETAKFVKK